jgi:hypothetical protein
MSTSTSTSTAEPQPHIDESAHIAPDSEDIHNAIRDLLADEYPDLATQHGGQVHRDLYLEITTKTFIRYFKFIFESWAGVASSFVRLLSFEISMGCLQPVIALTLIHVHLSRPVPLLGTLALLFSDHDRSHGRRRGLCFGQGPAHPSCLRAVPEHLAWRSVHCQYQ